MNLYIQIKNGLPFEHPIMEDNLKKAFPDIDINNLPENFARFVRVSRPVWGVYQINEGCTYEFVDGVYTDVWHIRDMTTEEKEAKQNLTKQEWLNTGGPASWIFDENTCSFNPPVPYPNDGARYRWAEETTSWVLVE